MRRRMRRMSPQLVLVLRQAAAAAGREWYGREMVEVTGLSEGTVYPMLGRLEARGFIVGRWETLDEWATARRGMRRYYRVTGAGLGAAQAAAEAAAGQGVDRTAPAPWPKKAEPVV